MSISPIYVKFNQQKKYDEIIDVRSENEFLEDHIPGAINLPVLNNEERKEVGTIYKKISAFEAKKIGAYLVSKNISHHLKTYFLDKNPRYSPLIYCWRGGQRSNSLGIILSQIGWQVKVLEGGYKTYRNYVIQQLKTLPLTLNYQILCGLTGSGKTYLLHQLAAQGYQVLDLEKIANHRGSLLGKEGTNKQESQPSQKYFDSLLLQELQTFDPHKTIWIESESYKIGNIYLPPNLWQKMKQSPCLEIQLPLEKRLDFLLKEYNYFRENSEELKENLKFLKSRYGRDKISQWFSWIDQEKWLEFVQDLLLTHYDPAYERSLEKTYTNRVHKIQLSTLDAESFLKAIKKL
ncbi:tRNA 2-selenouridine(34) synthase MnmH [Crocosphaera sp. XPORK-15E]|uniref:tRNA 2-selenouridine(34) synthase MnmH n=1 Tax=Crocosphaera sp. XPORK-15E TaxID=3110247 RepID=UPI002B20E182|nr:tRNA 2-selenouridine(34) synthase MnmH [Crocosphaera sp. XPORK-15E]MEA5535013.1 tRNA 2-selenouridine(34) synthase MnmH [Crocosphaera sp. XPORK-15E]